MTYYVSHINPIQKARVHKGTCLHCQEGTASEVLPKNAKGRTEWSKPFASAMEARTYMMKTFGCYKSLGMCPTCNP